MAPVFLVKAFHVFIMLMLVAFVVFSVLAASGRFDHWATRYIRRSKRTKRRALR